MDWLLDRQTDRQTDRHIYIYTIIYIHMMNYDELWWYSNDTSYTWKILSRIILGSKRRPAAQCCNHCTKAWVVVLGKRRLDFKGFKGVMGHGGYHRKMMSSSRKIGIYRIYIGIQCWINGIEWWFSMGFKGWFFQIFGFADDFCWQMWWFQGIWWEWVLVGLNGWLCGWPMHANA